MPSKCNKTFKLAATYSFTYRHFLAQLIESSTTFYLPGRTPAPPRLAAAAAPARTVHYHTMKFFLVSLALQQALLLLLTSTTTNNSNNEHSFIGVAHGFSTTPAPTTTRHQASDRRRPLFLTTRTQQLSPPHLLSSSSRVFASTSSSSSKEEAPTSSNDNDKEGGAAAAAEEEEKSKLDVFLSKKYPEFYKELVNDDMKKVFATAGTSLGQGKKCTVFVPNAKAIEELGDKKLQQLEDPRNVEIRDKMGSYHVIETDSVSAVELLTEDWTKVQPGKTKPNTVVASIVTMSGEVPVGREKSQDGGIFGLFRPPKEDGPIVIGPSAKIVQSFVVDDNYVHEVDSLISPRILWRYCDQLRIPGF